MAVSYRTGINILQIAFFIPALALALVLSFKQGWKAASSSWRFVIVLSLLRIAGDVAYFITLSHPTESAFVTVIICNLMGLAPLTLACVGLLGRVNETSRVFPSKFFAGISLLSLIGLIIGIAGAVQAVNDDGTYSINGLVKSGLALFIATFGLMLVALIGLAADARSSAAKRRLLGAETRILAAVALASPFLVVRIVYASIADYNGDPRFNFFDGNDTIYLCLGVLVELIVATICLAVGFLVPLPSQLHKDAAVALSSSPDPEGEVTRR